VKLTIVGCAPAWTRRPGHASSCYLVEHGGGTLMLDLGQGAFAELGRYRRPEELASIVISHLHPDHFIDLVPLRHYLKYEAAVAPRPAIHAPAQLAARLDGLFAERDFLADFSVSRLVPGPFSAAGLTVEAAHVTHIPDSFAFRISSSEGAGLVYSGDCGVAADLALLIRPGDVVLCEAAYGAGPAQNQIHLDAGAAAGVAARSGASTLILTHVLDTSDRAEALAAASAAFSGPLLLAEPGLAVDVGR
jgi:ribonuclease BN (tRNA processing enzyme)